MTVPRYGVAAWQRQRPRRSGHDGRAMTSLLVDRRDRTASPRTQRPLVLIATLGGAAAALAPLLVCVAVGIIGWFAADAGAHGAPRDGMRMGAVAWLMAHGS